LSATAFCTGIQSLDDITDPKSPCKKKRAQRNARFFEGVGGRDRKAVLAQHLVGKLAQMKVRTGSNRSSA
jgi:hypothetical protein